MKHLLALFFKIVVGGAILTAVEGALAEIGYLGLATTIFSVTVLSYVIGDLWILPDSGPVAAAIADWALIAATVWGAQFIVPGTVVSLSAAAWTAAAVAVWEILFHAFLIPIVLRQPTAR